MNAESAAGANGQDQPMIKWVDALRALEFLMEENDFNSAKGLVKKLLNGANVNREEVAVNETQWSKMFDELREEHYSRRRALASRLRGHHSNLTVAATLKGAPHNIAGLA
eukprot:TRINITY_DN37812_c0_g1_i6.p1 TRINITY_DN37812_c0_g1~~TRINITY_DN37812_c0_g1_i6.p1  ORF type:complete len:110 (-),score=9.01 TRINITY_DN37812_c0_g1_i6:98-427(-)